MHPLSRAPCSGSEPILLLAYPGLIVHSQLPCTAEGSKPGGNIPLGHSIQGVGVA